ncbi:MAG: hypothetical protein IKG27_04175 [Bacilli bacterium]|nr:hypothetical protein [Bacilli bacterium]
MNQESQGATLLNRINMVLPDHIMWIKSQFKKRQFIQTRGREVLIDVPKTHLKRIVNIPSKDDPGYIEAWVKVYNYGLDYLEGSINAACLENRIIRREGNNWVLNGKPIVWPRFNAEDAEYAKILDGILSEYNYIKNSYLQAKMKADSRVLFTKSSVMLNPVNKEQVTAPVVSSVKAEPIITQEEPKQLKIQKISDGALIDARDITSLKKQNTDLVILTCQNINNAHDEDLFVNNATMCRNAGLRTGVFIYGKATDEHMGNIELKRICKCLTRNFNNNFSSFVIYAVDNDYIMKNKDSDIKLLDFINVYNKIASTLKKMGYNVMLSMDVTSAKVIGDINNRYHMQNEHDVIYMAIVRDVDEINKNLSLIIIDPGNDYDVVNIKNRRILDELSDSSKSLVKAA